MHFAFLYYIFVERIMKKILDKYKGIHPGKIIDRDLKKVKLSQRSFAVTIGEHSQTINAIINGHRSLTIGLALKIEQALGYEEGFLLILQVYYDITEYKRSEAELSIKGVPNIRKILFWDTDFDKINWGLYKEAIIQRVVERGSSEEKAEIARFYNIDSTELKKYKTPNAYRMKVN